MARFKAIPETTAKGMLVYAVIDTVTKELKHVYDCFLRAESKANELNDKWEKEHENGTNRS